jgi:DNA-binding winged helix-turn-helix (wHTH) protein
MSEKVDLTQKSFYLGDYLVIPEQLILQSQGEAVQIDSKIMSLLVYFAENPGKVISREQLIEHVWQGNIVSESSINWAISQMRKMLGDSAAQGKYLKTISKKGYVLTADVSVKNQLIAEASSSTEILVPLKNTNKKRLVGFFLPITLLLLLGSYFSYFDSNQVEYSFGSAKLLTSLPGQEDDGRFSPDGTQLLFRHKSPEQFDWQLFIQPLTDNRKLAEYSDNGEKTGRLLASHRVLRAEPLLKDSYNYLSAEWAPDGKSIAVVRNNSLKCEMVMLRLDMRFRVVQQQAFNQCNKKGWSKLVWHPNGKRLYFTDQTSQENTYQVFEYILTDGTINKLTAPEENGLGDSFVDIDKEGRNLLILRDLNGVKTQFMSLNLDNKLLKELAVVESHYYSAYWGEQRDIWLNWGNKKVISYMPENENSTSLFSSTLNWNYNTKPYAKLNQAIFTSSSANRRDFLVIEEDNKWQPVIVQSDFNESFPSLNSKDELAFISNRSGIPQIWLGEKQQIQLSDVNDYGEFESLQWSNDDQYLLGIRNGYLASINYKEETLRMHYSGDLHPTNAYWSLDDKTIFFTAMQDKQWRLFQIAAENKNQKISLVTDIDIFNAQPLSANEILFTKPEQQGLWLFNKESQDARLLLPNFPWKNQWKVVGNAVFYVMKHQQLSIFKRLNLDTQEITTLANIKQNIEQNFAVSKSGTKIIATAYVVKESAIYQIPFNLKTR